MSCHRNSAFCIGRGQIVAGQRDTREIDREGGEFGRDSFARFAILCTISRIEYLSGLLLMKRLFFAFAILAATSLDSFADSCVDRFVGSWKWDDGSGPKVLKVDGTDNDGYTWSCNGNSYVSNSPAHVVGQLSDDGMRITGVMQNTKPRPVNFVLYRQGARPTQSGAASSACPNDPLSYVRVTRSGNNRFVLSNSCAKKAIQVNFKSAAIAPDCSLENDTRLLAIAGRATVQSYCGIEPGLVSATFAATNAR
jgi:hypothetical protein